MASEAESIYKELRERERQGNVRGEPETKKPIWEPLYLSAVQETQVQSLGF